MTETADTILVVDDAPQNVKLLRLILKDAGYDIVEAFSGPEALEKLHAERPSAMILDVRMPGMSGYEVCRAVRADPEFATLPVIMVTALSMPEERIKGIEAGATDFITKPFGKKELLARLQSSLSLVKAEHRNPLDALEQRLVLFTDPEYRLISMSSGVADTLGLSVETGADLAEALGTRGAVLPPSGETEPAEFRFQDGHGRKWPGRATAVLDPGGQVALYAIVFAEAQPQGG